VLAASETSVKFYQTTRRSNPEVSRPGYINHLIAKSVDIRLGTQSECTASLLTSFINLVSCLLSFVNVTTELEYFSAYVPLSVAVARTLNFLVLHFVFDHRKRERFPLPLPPAPLPLDGYCQVQILKPS
jgi:hypothetical protein